MTSGEEPDIESQLQELNERAGDLIQSCEFATSSRLYGELRQRARSEQRAWFYFIGTFFQMDQAQYLLDFHRMRERAVELIALLEDEERARQIQADFSPEEHEHFVYSMSSCAYENLAEATGQLEGYNSEGMHACIADGIQICRQTGKMECIRCFREYACDVYTAADDPEIAVHQCRLVIDHEGNWSDRGNRRWFASVKQAWLDALHGRLEDALASAENAIAATDEEGVSLKLESRLRGLIVQDTIRIASGLEPLMEQDPAFTQFPAAGECPLFEHMMDLNRALQHANAGKWDPASRILTHWDLRLQKSGARHLWFETRLRLIAVKRLSGQQKQAESLAKQLESAATTASDWLTIRRLQVLMQAESPSTLAAVGTPASAPTETEGSAVAAPHAQEGEEEASVTSQTAAAVTDADPEVSEFLKLLHAQMEALADDPSDEKLAAMQQAILGVTPEQPRHHRDAAAALHLMTFLIGSGIDGGDVWNWANAIAAPWQNKASVLSLLGTVGDRLRFSGDPEMEQRITAERTEQLFRRSLQLETSRPGNYMRAGDHFRAEDNMGEAERCYARAFRLDRTAGFLVSRLAELYMESERPRDALHVLDLSLREGCHEPQISFDAAMAAFSLDQYDATLTFLDRFERDGGESDWCSYYRAVCHYELRDDEAALAELNRADADPESAGWHIEVMRGVVLARLGLHEQALQHLNFAMDVPLFSLGALSPQGISSLLVRVLNCARMDLQDADLTATVERRLLRSGLMPDSYFDAIRNADTDEQEVRLFRCLVLQPLDERWVTDPDRLDEQGEWESYLTEWGVLATDEESATALALQWQTRCGTLPATVEDFHVSEDVFRDVAGVVWQAGRFPPTVMDE
jgi:tetratricopeptide (TPR) repeat protein